MKSKIIFVIFILLHATPALPQEAKTVLIFGGKTGYLGQKMVDVLKSMGHNPVYAQSRLENRESLIAEIQKVKPDFIVNAAGVTGKGSLEWCEKNRPETIRTNIIGTLNLIDVAHVFNIHVTNISTGSMYRYDDQHPIGSGKGFTETDEPNSDKSFYTKMKIHLEKIMLEYPNVLNLRITMPVAADFNPKNFLIRVGTYKKIMTLPISLTSLEDLWPIAIDMSIKGKTGNYNFVNPGTIALDEILDLYKQYINPHVTYETFSALEQIKILQSGRSSTELSVQKLLNEYPDIPHIKDSIINALKKMQSKI